MLTEEESRWLRKRSWGEVDLDVLEQNIKEMRSRLKPTTMHMAVVKADAYGQGVRYVAPFLEQIGVDWFGVAEIGEALELRRYGITKPILIFSAASEEYATYLAEHNLSVTVTCLEYAKALQQVAKEAGVRINVHIKLDTGMNRVGFLTDEAHREQSAQEIKEVAQTCDALHIQGIYTHFATADDGAPDKIAYKERQFRHFTQMLDLLKENGVEVGIRHCCNGGATVCDCCAAGATEDTKRYQMDMVRTGGLMYGYNPGPRSEGVLPLKPTFSLHSTVLHVKTISPEEKVGYSITYATQKPTVIATIGVGYADGYHRLLSNRGYLLYKGKRVPIVGNVCMDQIMVDATEVEHPKRGDKVTLVGTNGGETLTWKEITNLAETFDPEFACCFSRRNPRIYKQGGKEVAGLAYQTSLPVDVQVGL